MKRDVLSLVRKIKQFLITDDILWINEFILYEKFELVVEYICDKMLEYNIILNEKIGKKIQRIVKKNDLNPVRTWNAIMIKKDEGDSKHYIFYQGIPYEKLYQRCKAVLEEVKKLYSKDDFALQEDFLEHNELGLVIEDVCSGLKMDKIPIKRPLFEKIKNLAIDMEIDRKYLKGIVVRRKRRAKT